MKNRTYLIIAAFTFGLMAFPCQVVAADLSGCVKEEISDLKAAGFTWDEIKLHCRHGYVGSKNRSSDSILGAWTWNADCPSGNYSDTFKINDSNGDNFSGALNHNSLNNKISGSISGERIEFNRSYTHQGKTNHQVWSGIININDGSISDGLLVEDSSDTECSWSASK